MHLAMMLTQIIVTCKKERIIIIITYSSLLSGSPLPNGAVSTSTSKFDEKIEASSAKMYFHYYGQLLHQQNMLQDFVRTGNVLNFGLSYGLTCIS